MYVDMRKSWRFNRQRLLETSGPKDFSPKNMFLNRKMTDKVIAKAVGEWGYSQWEVADYLSLHYSTLSRLMEEIEKPTIKTRFHFSVL